MIRFPVVGQSLHDRLAAYGGIIRQYLVVTGHALYELGQFLRRRVWLPLHKMMEIFHILPLTGAILLFFVFATVGQLRDAYISYLENLDTSNSASIVSTAIALAAAVASVAALSAALHQTHFWLSARRMDLLYANISDPEAGSILRGVQRMAAVGLALAPWLGILFGLSGAHEYVDNACQQLQKANVPLRHIVDMQHLPTTGAYLPLASAAALGLAIAVFLDRFRRDRVLQWAAIIATPFAAGGLFLLLSDVRLQSLTATQTTSAALAFALCSGWYYAGYYALRRMRAPYIYTKPFYPEWGVNRRLRRRVFQFVWAAAPWFAVGCGFAVVSDVPGRRLCGLSDGGLDQAFAIDGLASHWTILPVAMTWVAAIGLLVAALLDALRGTAALRRTVVVGVAALAILHVVALHLGGDAAVWLFRLVGPLATISLGLLFLFSIFAVLAILSQKSGFPALALVLLAITVSALFPVPIEVTVFALMALCGIFAVMALVSRLYAVAGVAALLVLPGVLAEVSEPRRDPSLPNREPPVALQDQFFLQDQFDRWLALRRKESAWPSAAKYPVFIIAVEGGGIYAASAASLFLAKLQDQDPRFSRHVFAISGVSGGAIGATVFLALDRTMYGSTPSSADPSPRTTDRSAAGCPLTSTKRAPERGQPASPAGATGSMESVVSKIMLDDHISPLVGAIFPELFGLYPPGRVCALERSFTYSVQSRDGPAALELDKGVDAWDPSDGTPALVLNTTWVETGSRVAFSSFPLHPADDSMYSFSDVGMPGEKGTPAIRAAVASARFPAILPPYSVMMGGGASDGGKDEGTRWDFVDGGYSDNSGAGTALALYNGLKARAKDENYEISIVLVTSSDPQPDLTGKNVTIRGTPFQDTLAPVAAIEKVREGLGNQAVARVCDEFFKVKTDCGSHASDATALFRIVEIENHAFDLPLGFKLSRTTFDLVDWMLGEASLCLAPTPNQPSVQQRNSCVLKYIEDKLDGK
ncbi:MAG: hypothetical protein ABSC25_23235 [Roseiarcus sp.]|jgi:hypothetical protein